MSQGRRPRAAIAIALVVSFMSGGAALIYQVAWQRVLTLYYGVGAVSVAIVVAVLMAGLGFAALALAPGVVSSRVDFVYALF